MSIKELHLVQPAIAKVISSDIDELAGCMDGWDNDWRQLETGQPQNRVEVIAGQHTVIHQFHLSHSIHQQGTVPSQLMTFGFPTSQSLMSWGGREVDPCLSTQCMRTVLSLVDNLKKDLEETRLRIRKLKVQ